MSRIRVAATIALCHLIVGWAGKGASTMAQVQSILELRQPFETPREETPGFAEVSDVDSAAADLDARFPAPDAGWDPAAIHSAETSPDGDEGFSTRPECSECDQLTDCDCCAAEAHPGWRYDLGISALKSHMATSELASWPDDVGPAGRLGIGYEWGNGFGIRTQAWTYSMKGELQSQASLSSYPFSPFIFYDYGYYIPGAVNQLLYAPYLQNYAFTQRFELHASTVYLDISKSLYSRHGEFTFGMGPAFGHLAFKFPDAHDGSTYDGGGISVFGEGYAPVVERRRWELALTGQTRAALLTGNWGVAALSTGNEHSQNMSIMTLSVGPELRYRTSASNDRYLFLRTVAEFQQWRSDRMGPVTGDTLGLQGASMNFGALW